MAEQNVNVSSSFQAAGFTFEALLRLSGNDAFSASYSVPAAQPGNLTTRTDDNTGTLTMTNAGHGIITGDRLDLYWVGGCRRGIVVGTVSGVSVPIDLGSGDNLPADEFAIVASVPLDASFPCVNADLLLIAVKCNVEGQFTFVEADDTTEDWTKHIEPEIAGQMTSEFWASGMGAAPMTGTAISQVFLSHADIAAAHVMTAVYLSA